MTEKLHLYWKVKYTFAYSIFLIQKSNVTFYDFFFRNIACNWISLNKWIEHQNNNYLLNRFLTQKNIYIYNHCDKAFLYAFAKYCFDVCKRKFHLLRAGGQCRGRLAVWTNNKRLLYKSAPSKTRRIHAWL